jgi:hypothetical protein
MVSAVSSLDGGQMFKFSFMAISLFYLTGSLSFAGNFTDVKSPDSKFSVRLSETEVVEVLNLETQLVELNCQQIFGSNQKTKNLCKKDLAKKDWQVIWAPTSRNVVIRLFGEVSAFQVVDGAAIVSLNESSSSHAEDLNLGNLYLREFNIDSSSWSPSGERVIFFGTGGDWTPFYFSTGPTPRIDYVGGEIKDFVTTMLWGKTDTSRIEWTKNSDLVFYFGRGEKCASGRLDNEGRGIIDRSFVDTHLCKN